MFSNLPRGSGSKNFFTKSFFFFAVFASFAVKKVLRIEDIQRNDEHNELRFFIDFTLDGAGGLGIGAAAGGPVAASTRKWITALLAVVGLAATMVLQILPIGQGRTAFNGMIAADGFSQFLNVAFPGQRHRGHRPGLRILERMGWQRGEYYTLLIFSICGMMLMAYAADLIVVFLALELLSIPLYVLAGFARARLDSEEAALKYFLLGAFAAGFVLYGVAMVFGATGHTGLQDIAAALKAGTANMTLFLVGAGLLLVGFGFKVAAAPFHMWMPDVYQGAPSPVTGFMSVGAKAAGFAGPAARLCHCFPSLSFNIAPILWVLAALTMLVGNVAAISQG